MEQNKLRLEDCCLTIEQAKELKKLGVDFGDTIYCFTEVDDKRWSDIHLRTSDCAYEIKESCDKFCKDGILLTPTLTNSEILEMLPKEIEDKSIIVRAYEDRWVVEYKNHLFIPVFSKSLLRDALFEMIKWLKTNKLI